MKPLEASDDFGAWTPLATNRAVDGRVVFMDPAATNVPARLYRAVSAP